MASIGALARRLLAARAADAATVAQMQRYLKTSMPMFGVRKPAQRELVATLADAFRPTSSGEYRSHTLELWSGEQREFKYLAILYARRFQEHVTLESVPVYERMVREGAWWDLVDETAVHLVGTVLLREREAMRPILDAWIADDDLWIRRSAILAHNAHKDATDFEQLFRFALKLAPETDFFAQKAVGWALRHQSHRVPDDIAAFVLAHEDKWSTVTWTEATKHLDPAYPGLAEAKPRRKGRRGRKRGRSEAT